MRESQRRERREFGEPAGENERELRSQLEMFKGEIRGLKNELKSIEYDYEKKIAYKKKEWKK